MSIVISDNEAKQRIAANLRSFLDQSGWSQADLARAAKTTDMTVSYAIRGKSAPGAAILARIAEALSVTIDDLLAESPKKIRQAV